VIRYDGHAETARRWYRDYIKGTGSQVDFERIRRLIKEIEDAKNTGMHALREAQVD